jgi:hypothetical protein
MADFRFTCDRAPPSSLGHGAIALVPDLGGTDVFGLGFLVHLDLPTAPALFRFEMSSDAQGEAQSPPIAIAGDPSAVGLTLYAQSFWSWTSCPIPFVTVSSSSSRGLAFTILAP